MSEEMQPEDAMDGMENGNGANGDAELQDITPISGMYRNYFLDYASYVILDRAVPYLDDGLKPVQRRILHALKEMDDGRFNKVANVIGNTMQYHPHGDAAIGDAIVNLGQKELLLDTQGNWGNILTGDGAAAPRYIEVRLSKFALEVAFNAQTTEWQMSYDGRKREPVTLPLKFPLVLAQGVEGIAVGLSTKIMPHNFRELLEASIAYLKGKEFELYPDFPTGGMVAVGNYQDGHRGGKIRVRAKIQELDKKTLVITEIPYGTTTTSLIDSILKANDKGKIKIRKIDDNTARNVEIVIHLPKGVSPAIAIDGLYAFTQCEVSISPNCCIIIDDKPVFTDVKTVLELSTEKTVALLKQELEIRKGELEDQWHYSSLEKIFIENRIYRDIEESETWEAVIEAIDTGLDPFKHLLYREVTRDDIIRLTEIKIKRISKYDSFKADERIKAIEEELEQVKHNLAHLVEYAIDWFAHLLKKYGADKERKTEIRAFDTIEATQVAVANQKLYVNREDGFIGIGLKKAEYVSECSDIDDIIVFRKDGGMMVTRVSDKTFVGKGILYAGVWNKTDDRMVFHMAYTDSVDKRTYVKRFQVLSITRDKEYFLTKSKKKGSVLFFSANPNGESETVTVRMKPGRVRKQTYDYDFGSIGIKGRSAGGNLLTKYPVSRVVFKSKGTSTLGGRDIWFDSSVRRLNTQEIGQYLGQFNGDNRILVLYDDGTYEVTNYELSNRYDGKGTILEILRLRKDTVVSVIYFEGEKQQYNVKRFQIETSKLDTKYNYLSETDGTRLVFVTAKHLPVVKVRFFKKSEEDRELDLAEFIDVKGWKALGNRLSESRVRDVKLERFEELPEELPQAEVEAANEGEAADSENFTAQNPDDIPMEVEGPTLFDSGKTEE